MLSHRDHIITTATQYSTQQKYTRRRLDTRRAARHDVLSRSSFDL